MRRTQTLALALAAIVSIAAPVGAQPAPGQRDTAKAEELFREANRFVAQQKWTEAEAKFRAALELNPTFDVAVNLGQTQYRLGKFRDAAENLAFALRHWPLILKEKRDTAERRLAEVKKQIGTVAIRVNVSGATVRVDGMITGTSPIDHELYVELGVRTVEATLAGYDGAKQTIEAAKGSEQVMTLTLRAATPPLPPAASTSAPPPSSSSGVPKREGPPIALVIAGGALAAGGLAAGIGLTIAANGKTAEAEDLRRQLGSRSACSGSPVANASSCESLRSSVVGRDGLTNAAIGSFVTAGVFALATVGLGVWAASTPKTAARVQVVPVAGTEHGGVVVVGSW